MLKDAHDLCISPKAMELRAQFNMLSNTKSFMNGIAQNLSMTFKEAYDDLPAMLKINKTNWIVLEQYIHGRFQFLALYTSGEEIKIIQNTVLSDLLSDIKNGRISAKL